MSATQFFADRDALMATARDVFNGLVSYQEVDDRLTARHMDVLFVVIYTYDNGCPEDYDQSIVGHFRHHDDAAFVMQSLSKNDGGGDVSYHIERRRVY